MPHPSVLSVFVSVAFQVPHSTMSVGASLCHRFEIPQPLRHCPVQSTDRATANHCSWFMEAIQVGLAFASRCSCVVFIHVFPFVLCAIPTSYMSRKCHIPCLVVRVLEKNICMPFLTMTNSNLRVMLFASCTIALCPPSVWFFTGILSVHFFLFLFVCVSCTVSLRQPLCFHMFLPSSLYPAV